MVKQVNYLIKYMILALIVANSMTVQATVAYFSPVRVASETLSFEFNVRHVDVTIIYDSELRRVFLDFSPIINHDIVIDEIFLHYNDTPTLVEQINIDNDLIALSTPANLESTETIENITVSGKCNYNGQPMFFGGTTAILIDQIHEPIESIESIELIVPTEPVEPVETVDTVEPVEPSEPTELTEPAEPNELTEPTEPTEPAESTEPTEPADDN